MEHEEHLPDEAVHEYRVSPVAGEPLLYQVEYWRKRAKFFENDCYGKIKIIEEISEKLQNREDDSGDWWRSM